MLPNQRAQSPSKRYNVRRSADPTPPNRQRSKGKEDGERGGEGCALPGIGGRGTRNDPHYLLPVVSGRGTRDDPHYISPPDQGGDQHQTKLQEKDHSKRQERGSAREFLSRSVGRAKGILAIRPRKDGTRTGLTSTERPADNVQSPRANASLGSGELSSIRHTSQARPEVNRGIGSSRISRSPSAIPPPRSPQSRDASDPRELSERLAEVSWGTTVANIQPLNSFKEYGHHIDRAGPSAASTISNLPRRSQQENVVNFPKPPYPSLAGPVRSGNGELTWTSLFSENSVIPPGANTGSRPLRQANQQGETDVEQPPTPTADSRTRVDTAHNMPGAFCARSPQLTRHVSDTLLAQHRASRRGGPCPGLGRDAPHLTSPTGGNRDRTVNPEWLLCQPPKGGSFYSRPPPPGSGVTAFPGNGLGQNPFGHQPNRPWAVMFRESEDEQDVASETLAPRMPRRLDPTSIQRHLPPGLPVPCSSMPTASALLTNPGPFRPMDWGSDLGAATNPSNSPSEDMEKIGEPLSHCPRRSTPSRQLVEGIYASFHEEPIDPTSVAPEIRTDLGAAGSEFLSRRPGGAKSTISNWRRRADSNVQGFKELSKRAVGQTGKMAGALVRGGMKALRPLAGRVSQEKYDKYVEILRQTAEGVPPSSCEAVDIKALHRKKCRNPKRMTSEELRVLALASIDVDYDALIAGSDTSGARYVSEEGIDKWQNAIEPHGEDHYVAGSQPLRPAEAKNPVTAPSWFLTTPEGLGLAPGISQQGGRSRQERTSFRQAASQATVNTGQRLGANNFSHFTPNHPAAVRPQTMYRPARPDHSCYQPRTGPNEAQLQIEDPRFRRDPLTHANTPSPVNEMPSLGLTGKMTLLPGPGKPYMWTDRRISEGWKPNGDCDLRKIKGAFGGRVFERREAVSTAASEAGAVLSSDARDAAKSLIAAAEPAKEVEGVENAGLSVRGPTTSRSPRSRKNSGGSRRRSSGASGRKEEEEGPRSKSWPRMGESRVGEVLEEMQGGVTI
ncbi:MAG: hypothetical protein M1840_008632 [Geoglossum simile]|nr:MAG: hypothetical protein M1840_008632 [Geoglossum simile]